MWWLLGISSSLGKSLGSSFAGMLDAVTHLLVAVVSKALDDSVLVLSAHLFLGHLELALLLGDLDLDTDDLGEQLLQVGGSSIIHLPCGAGDSLLLVDKLVELVQQEGSGGLVLLVEDLDLAVAVDRGKVPCGHHVASGGLGLDVVLGGHVGLGVGEGDQSVGISRLRGVDQLLGLGVDSVHVCSESAVLAMFGAGDKSEGNVVGLERQGSGIVRKVGNEGTQGLSLDELLLDL